VSERAEIVWERECAVAVLANQNLCPKYHMPCWVCCLLHLLTGLLRSVVSGRFDRFQLSAHNATWLEDRDGHVAKYCASPDLVCPHHAATRSDDYLLHAYPYWGYEEASSIQ
jgi:hypothetical protein